jgi:hypothetical protein
VGLSGTEALDSEMISIGYALIHGIPVRSPDSEVNQMARICAIVESAHPQMLDAVRQIFVMVDKIACYRAGWMS